MFKGQRNNKGRPKGSPNKATNKIREAITLIIEDNIEQLEKDLVELEPKDRIKAIIDLAKFCVPTLKSVEEKYTGAGSEINPVVIWNETKTYSKD